MTAPYVWACICGTTGRGETPAQTHARTCPLMGRPWTNPDHPRPDGLPTDDGHGESGGRG